jgi:hypothetical protein
MMSASAIQERAGRPPSRVRWLCGIHFLIALTLLAAVPPALNEVLRNTFFSLRSGWLHRGELQSWASWALDQFFLATPYWASYEPGWIVGLLPSLLVASAAWGLRKQRAWARRLAIGFHALTAVAALAALAWVVYDYVAIPKGGGPDSFAGLVVIVYAVVGAAAFGCLVVSGGLLWWLGRPATRSCFETKGRRNTRTLVACYVGVTVALLVSELVYNRMAVYRGEAAYDGKTTGDWLVLLASRSAATRRAAVAELSESAESAPVLREMYRDRPSRPDEIHPVPREAGRPLYWSRAWRTPEWKELTEVWRRLGPDRT